MFRDTRVQERGGIRPGRIDKICRTVRNHDILPLSIGKASVVSIGRQSMGVGSGVGSGDVEQDVRGAVTETSFPRGTRGLEVLQRRAVNHYGTTHPIGFPRTP